MNDAALLALAEIAELSCEDNGPAMHEVHRIASKALSAYPGMSDGNIVMSFLSYVTLVAMVVKRQRVEEALNRIVAEVKEKNRV